MSTPGAPQQIGPQEAIQLAFQNYTKFDGRATKPEFWWLAGALWVAGIVLYLLDLALFGFPIPSLLFWLATVVPYIAVGIRRLHDTDREGWWILTGFIPCVGIFIIIYLMIQDGTPGPNRYGPPPA